MPDEKQNGLLRDMLDSADAIQRSLGGLDYDRSMGNPEKQDAVLRRFEIVGEAASRLSPETRALFPSIPFRSIRGTRNIIAHDYGVVDLDQVWQTTSTDVEPFIVVLRSCFDQPD